MTVNLDQPIIIDPLKNTEYTSLLKDLQGNILKSHGRDHAVHMFIRFKDQDLAKDWIRRFADTYVTSAKQQYEDSDKYNTETRAGRLFAGRLFANLLLSAHGYEALGCASEKIPKDYSFRRGQKNARGKLCDPSSEVWEDGFRGNIDALILLADDYSDRLYSKVQQIADEVRKFASIVHIDRGQVLRNSDKEAIEHFGYVDGVSQPLFFQKDIDKAKCLGINKWDPTATLDLVLVRDLHGEGPHSFGSFAVYRKLQQDVHSYTESVNKRALGSEVKKLAGIPAVEKLARSAKEKELAESAKEKELAESKIVSEAIAEASIVGRFKHGTPLTMQDDSVSGSGIPNNFAFDENCPISAHIRKVNPRSDSMKEHRIARRSVPYGVPYDKYSKPEDKERGLLFLCFQSNIGNQFELIQSLWANRNDFIKRNAGLDRIIGQNSQQAGDRFITMLGGEYFFAPSISGLKIIAG